MLRRYRYFQLSKGPRGVLFAYMQRLTGYSRQHVSKLIAQYRDTQSLKPRKRVSRTSFARQCTAEDIALLAHVTMGSGFHGNDKLEALLIQIECYKITLARRQYQRGFQVIHLHDQVA